MKTANEAPNADLLLRILLIKDVVMVCFLPCSLRRGTESQRQLSPRMTHHALDRACCFWEGEISIKHNFNAQVSSIDSIRPTRRCVQPSAALVIMSGASLGNVGVNKVAKEKLNVNNPYGHHWSTWGKIVKPFLYSCMQHIVRQPVAQHCSATTAQQCCIVPGQAVSSRGWSLGSPSFTNTCKPCIALLRSFLHLHTGPGGLPPKSGRFMEVPFR
jgi:hypothetical protein